MISIVEMRHLTILLLALILDRMLGEPSHWHPVAAFGKLAQEVEKQLNLPTLTPILRRFNGVLALVVLAIPIFFVTVVITRIPFLGYVAEVFILYFTFGNRSLIEHARAVVSALKTNDLEAARSQVAMLVSRETSSLSEVGVTRAAVESVLENGNDAVFASIFWFLCLGTPGAVLYRLVNTLDAMWGYKNDRFLDFGWAAARFDDLLNYIPAKLTALTYALSGNFSRAWTCWKSQAPRWYSLNAGTVMAAGAGALGVEVGGPAVYDGKVNEERPILGAGTPPTAADIERSISLLQKSLSIWVVAAAVICLTFFR